MVTSAASSEAWGLQASVGNKGNRVKPVSTSVLNLSNVLTLGNAPLCWTAALSSLRRRVDLLHTVSQQYLDVVDIRPVPNNELHSVESC